MRGRLAIVNRDIVRVSMVVMKLMMVLLWLVEYGQRHTVRSSRSGVMAAVNVNKFGASSR